MLSTDGVRAHRMERNLRNNSPFWYNLTSNSSTPGSSKITLTVWWTASCNKWEQVKYAVFVNDNIGQESAILNFTLPILAITSVKSTSLPLLKDRLHTQDLRSQSNKHWQSWVHRQLQGIQISKQQILTITGKYTYFWVVFNFSAWNLWSLIFALQHFNSNYISSEWDWGRVECTQDPTTTS